MNQGRINPNPRGISRVLASWMILPTEEKAGIACNYSFSFVSISITCLYEFQSKSGAVVDQKSSDGYNSSLIISKTAAPKDLIFMQSTIVNNYGFIICLFYKLSYKFINIFVK
jgi:hypothetical protein